MLHREIGIQIGVIEAVRVTTLGWMAPINPSSATEESTIGLWVRFLLVQPTEPA